MKGILHHMFRTLHEPRFVVTDTAVSGRTGYLRWPFTFHPRRTAPQWTLQGVSEVHVDAQGRVTEHIDHWDAGSQIYARLPVLGPVIRWVARRAGG